MATASGNMLRISSYSIVYGYSNWCRKRVIPLINRIKDGVWGMGYGIVDSGTISMVPASACDRVLYRGSGVGMAPFSALFPVRSMVEVQVWMIDQDP
jgi:hypothetical protein